MKKLRITENAFGDGNAQVREVILRTPDVTQEVFLSGMHLCTHHWLGW